MTRNIALYARNPIYLATRVCFTQGGICGVNQWGVKVPVESPEKSTRILSIFTKFNKNTFPGIKHSFYYDFVINEYNDFDDWV